MDGLITGIVDNLNTAMELKSELGNAGYYDRDISLVTEDNPSTTGPLQAIPISDIPQELMSYGATEEIANNYYEEIEGDYYLVVVSVYNNDVENVQNIFSNYYAKDIQFITR